MSKRSKKYSDDYKGKRTGRIIGIVLAIILGTTCLMSVVAFASDGYTNKEPTSWFSKELNEANLIDVEKYVVKDGQDDGKGIEVFVDKEGVIKLNGKATSDNTFTVCEVMLQPGTYTISGVKSCDDYGLQAVLSNGAVAKAGTSSDNFTIEQSQTVAVQIYVKEDVRLFYKSFKPCLVTGEDAGSMYE